jgi:hypothetical protein
MLLSRIGFLDILQTVFVIGKLTDTLGIGSWSWWLVFSPLIAAFCFADVCYTLLKRIGWKKYY